MGSVDERSTRAQGRSALARLSATPVAAVFALGALVSACATDREATGSFATTRLAAATPAAAGPTVSFESIDGPPAAVFGRLVRSLESEALARRVAVVSRSAPAQYRLRGYLAVKIERRQPSVVWVFDVYGSDQGRVMRIAGEERAGTRGGKDWSVADDAVIARVAQATLRDLTTFLANPAGGEPPPPHPREPASNVVALNTSSPGEDAPFADKTAGTTRF